MKREPRSLTHLRHAAHRIHGAVWMIDSGASTLLCSWVSRTHPLEHGKNPKTFLSDSMALADKATVLRRNLSTTDRQQAIRTERSGADIEKPGEMARQLRANLENWHVTIKRYTVSVATEEPRSE